MPEGPGADLLVWEAKVYWISSMVIGVVVDWYHSSEMCGWSVYSICQVEKLTIGCIFLWCVHCWKWFLVISSIWRGSVIIWGSGLYMISLLRRMCFCGHSRILCIIAFLLLASISNLRLVKNLICCVCLLSESFLKVILISLRSCERLLCHIEIEEILLVSVGILGSDRECLDVREW